MDGNVNIYRRICVVVLFFYFPPPKALDEIVPIVGALVGGGRLLGRPLVGGELE